MKILFWFPIIIREFLKAHLLKPTPSSESTREIEHAVRNEARLIAWKIKSMTHRSEM